MKKILLAGVISALALPVIAAETTTITTSSPEAMTTTTTTTSQQFGKSSSETEPSMQKEEESFLQKEEAAPAAEATTAPAVDALPETGGGFKQPLDQQRMEDPASDATSPAAGPHRLDDPTIEDESGEFAPKIDDIDSMEDYN